MFGHEAGNPDGEIDDGFLVQGRTSEPIDNFTCHGLGQHAFHVLGFQDADARCSVGQQFHKPSPMADHGDGTETRILFGPDKKFKTRTGHRLDENTVQFRYPVSPNVFQQLLECSAEFFVVFEV